MQVIKVTERNNSGELTMTYGKEDVDYRTDGNAASGYVFNGAESVIWRRIRNNMHSNLTSMYQSLDSAGCWSSTSLINQFDAWQSQFPEELWRLDIERKYYRTYQGGGLNAGATPQPTPRYLKEMMNGRKKYQRRQFERDQEVYMGTKYLASTITADQIMFRCNTPIEAVVEPSYDLTITPYSDMYLSVAFGNSSNTVQIRAKANTQYTVTCPLTDNMDDTAFLIYSASHIKALNDLSACYIHDNDFSKATKLQTLKIGNTTAGYNNAFLTTLNMGNNALLTSLDIRNCGTLSGSLNLSSCGNLESLYAQGTALTTVLFANYGKVTNVYLPSTIKSLTMKNLSYLTNFNCTYNVLEKLVKENGVVNELTIVQSAYDTLNSVRLVGINWTLSSTTIMNALAALSDCYLSGTVNITGAIRDREITVYGTKWPDLTVTYEQSNLVPQFSVTYKNYDGTVLATTYVDQNTIPPDPVSTGLCSQPTKPADAQYTYTFASWSGIDTAVMANTIITATYTTSDRYYTVNWYANLGDTSPLLTASNVGYGAEAIYTGTAPTKTSEESSAYYNLFSGWDKSTGFIKSDLNVYAVWKRCVLPSPTYTAGVSNGVEISEMSAEQIYALKRANKFADANYNVTMKDYVEITMGNDFNFSNVESEVLIGEDGTLHEGRLDIHNNTVYETDIKLFDEDSPSFVLAIDFRFITTTSGATLVSAFDADGNKGFKLSYTTYPQITWGDVVQTFGYGNYRDIVVLRHIKGSKDLYIYASNAANSSNFSADIVSVTKTRTTSPDTDSILVFGGQNASGGTYTNKCEGNIFWAKIWYDDIGNDVCKQIAAWPREEIRMEYFGNKRYYLESDSTAKSNASFICNHLLADRTYQMNTQNTNSGGWPACLMRTMLNNRFYKGLPITWRSMIESVKIFSTGGGGSSSVVFSYDKVYLPCTFEIGGNDYGEGNYLTGTWFNDKHRSKFKGLVNDYATWYTGTTEPSSVASNTTPEPGDIWNRSNTMYYLFSEEDIAAFGYNPSFTTSAGDGWVNLHSAYWWLRSPYTGGSSYFWSVYPYGGFSASSASNSHGVAPCFSI